MEFLEDIIYSIVGPNSVLWSFVILYVFTASNSTSPFGLLLAIVVVAKPQSIQDAWASYASNPAELLSIWIPFAILLTYWTHGLLLLLLDITKWSPLYKYKLQPRVGLDFERVPRLLLRVLFVQLVVFLPLSWVVSWLSVNLNIGVHVSQELPSNRTLIIDIIGFSVVDEFLFYFAHRAAHHKSVYKYVHKIHHEYTAPVALATDYCHPLEHIFVNVLPMMAYIVVGTDSFSYLVWWVLAYLASQTNHSGYRFPPANWTREAQPDFHDKHHERFDCNYGSLFGALDWAFGTLHKQTPAKTNQQ